MLLSRFTSEFKRHSAGPDNYPHQRPDEKPKAHDKPFPRYSAGNWPIFPCAFKSFVGF